MCLGLASIFLCICVNACVCEFFNMYTHSIAQHSSVHIGKLYPHIEKYTPCLQEQKKKDTKNKIQET